MSSHHIVRDEQEPALLLHRLPQTFTLLHSLLEWSPTVVCCEPSIADYTTLGHKLDVALVGLQKIKFWEGALREQLPVKILALSGESFLETGLYLLHKEGHKAANVVTTEDAFSEVIQCLLNWQHLLDLVVLSEKQRVIIQHRAVFKKWLPAEAQLLLTPLGEDQEFTTKGFALNLSGEVIRGKELVSVLESGLVTIAVNQGSYLISESLDA